MGVDLPVGQSSIPCRKISTIAARQRELKGAAGGPSGDEEFISLIAKCERTLQADREDVRTRRTPRDQTFSALREPPPSAVKLRAAT